MGQPKHGKSPPGPSLSTTPPKPGNRIINSRRVSNNRVCNTRPRDLCTSRNRLPTQENQFTSATLTTDSQSTVDSYNSQVLNFITAPKISKSPLQDYMHDMKAIKESRKTIYETRTHLVHNHNEHGRQWDNEGRDDLACRANQACDRAAKKIAAVVDQRFQHHGKGHGGIATLAKNGSYITDDIKSIITEKRTHDLLSIIPHKITTGPQHDQPDQQTRNIALRQPHG